MDNALARNVGSFDLLHLHSVFLWPTTAAARVARRARIPYLLSPRGMLVEDLIRRKSRLVKYAWINLCERANIAGAASMHLTADIEADEFRRLGLRASRIDVVPNGIDLPAEASATRKAQATDPTRARILSLGRVNWKKGLDRLIPAMAFVPGAELVIAGNDEEGYETQLEACAREAGVLNRVFFVGPVYGARKWELIHSCDLFVMASYSENFGMAALEAMACGRPVVVTPEVGLARTIEEAGAGVVVDGNPETLGSAIAALIADPVRRSKMGEAGSRTALQKFSWSAIAKQVEAIYSEVCN